MSRKIVIMISGKRCSGKDTIADIFKKQHSANICKTSFGYVMKQDYCKTQQDLVPEQLLDRTIKEKHRCNLIEFAESMKVKNGMDYWAKRCWETNKDNTIILISDWRFLEEYLFFKKLRDKNVINKLITIRINVSEEIKRKRGWIPNPKVDTHRGEIELDSFEDFDYVIRNDGNKNKLKEICNIIDLYN